MSPAPGDASRPGDHRLSTRAAPQRKEAAMERRRTLRDRRRWGALLVAPLLAPVLALALVVANPVTAYAATVANSGQTAYAWSHDGWQPGNWANCAVTAFY